MKTATAAFLFSPQWMKGPLLSDHMWCQSKSFSSIVTCRLNNYCQSVRAPRQLRTLQRTICFFLFAFLSSREWGFFSKSASVAGPGFFLIPLIVCQNPVSRCGVSSSFLSGAPWTRTEKSKQHRSFSMLFCFSQHWIWNTKEPLTKLSKLFHILLLGSSNSQPLPVILRQR